MVNSVLCNERLGIDAGGKGDGAARLDGAQQERWMNDSGFETHRDAAKCSALQRSAVEVAFLGLKGWSGHQARGKPRCRGEGQALDGDVWDAHRSVVSDVGWESGVG